MFHGVLAFFNELNDLIHTAKMYLMRSLANSEHLFYKYVFMYVFIYDRF